MIPITAHEIKDSFLTFIIYDLLNPFSTFRNLLKNEQGT